MKSMALRGTQRIHAFGLLGILLAACAWAGPSANEGRIPERVLLGITADPAHSQSVTWRTAVPVESPQAQIAPSSANPAFGDGAVTVAARSAQYATGTGENVVHYEALFSGLEPGKEYGYRVGDGTVWSEWFEFSSAGDKSQPFRFIYLGDAQANVKSLWSRTVRAAYRHAPDAALLLYAGDLINDGYKDDLWKEWCDGLGFIGAMTRNLPAVGNHDMNLPKDAQGEPTAAFPLWKAHFALPGNGPSDASILEDEAYWVDYQGVRFIVLEANAFSPENYDPAARALAQKKQAEWLEPLLANNPTRWTVMLHHEPMYQVGKNDDNPDFRHTFLPLYDKYGVDLALQGHDHVYARSQKLAAGKVVKADARGTVYVVSVSGPKMYDYNPTFVDLMKKTIDHTQLYQVVDVSNDSLRLNTYSIGGEWMDGFELRKDATGKSTLVELTGSSS